MTQGFLRVQDERKLESAIINPLPWRLPSSYRDRGIHCQRSDKTDSSQPTTRSSTEKLIVAPSFGDQDYGKSHGIYDRYSYSLRLH